MPNTPNTVNNKINSLQFSYGNPDDNYKKFESEYTSEAYVMRKILATPLCAISIVKMIINLAKAIFYGIPQSFKGNRLPLQAAIYHAVRDMQSALGLIIMIFNDKLGLYITDNAWTQKDYYTSVIQENVDPNPVKKENIIPPKNNPKSSMSINGVEISHFDEAIEITLFDLQKMTAEERQEAIKKFKLQDSLNKMGGEEEFFKKLSASSEEVLKLCTFYELQLFQSSKLIYALLSDVEFEKLTLNELKDTSKEQGKFIGERLKLLEDQILSKTETLSDLSLLDLPIINLPNVSAIEINKVLDSFPSSLYILITDEQLKGLDLKDLSANQFTDLFPYDSSGKQEKRFANLSVELVQSILTKLDETRLSYISDEQLKKLDLKDLSSNQLEALFPYDSSDKQEKRFANLSVELVQSILTKLDKTRLSYISGEQLKKLDLKDLSSDQLEALFPYDSSDKQEKRFANLCVELVQSILTKLDKTRLSYISDEQLKKLDLKDLSSNQLEALFPYDSSGKQEKRFANLSVELVQSILTKLDKTRLSYISGEQLKKLDLKDLSSDQLEALFPYDDSSGKQKTRFAHLSIKLVQNILQKLDQTRLSYISDEQLKGLDLKNLSANQLKELFPYDPSGNQEKRFANLSVEQVQSILTKLYQTRLLYISDEQLKKLDLKDLTDKQIKDLFPCHSRSKQKTRFANLPVEQVQNILPKLDETRLSHISDEQLKKLDLKDLTDKQLKKLFPTLSEEGIRKESGFSHSYSYSNVNGKVTEEEKSGMTKEEVQKELQSRIQVNTARLAMLSDEQFNQIKDKLEEAIRNLRK